MFVTETGWESELKGWPSDVSSCGLWVGSESGINFVQPQAETTYMYKTGMRERSTPTPWFFILTATVVSIGFVNGACMYSSHLLSAGSWTNWLNRIKFCPLPVGNNVQRKENGTTAKFTERICHCWFCDRYNLTFLYRKHWLNLMTESMI